MKKIIIIILTFISLQVFANTKFLQKINIDINNAINNVSKIKNWHNKAEFKALIQNWKKIESSYILLDLDEDYFDILRYIDIFHNSRQSIGSQLRSIIISNDRLDIIMYRHSYKTINALEYMLYQDIKNDRVVTMIKIITDNIKKQLYNIKYGYAKYTQTFDNNNKIKAFLLNTLASETYKLKEWRIGDVVGLSKKYKIANNSRSEYAFSKNSILAINAILLNQQQILKIVFINDKKIHQDVKNAINIINIMLKAISSIKNDDFSQHKNLYNLGNKLLKMYHLTMLDKLDFARKILDADGD